MPNSNKNDIKEKTLFENINNFDDFRNQFQRTIDFVVQNQITTMDINNFLATSGIKLEDNGCQFKINDIPTAQSNTNTNTNSTPNLSSEKKEEIKDDINQNILNEITAGLNEQKQNPQVCTKQFFDNLEAFELKVDSAEILWLLERLKSEENQNIEEDQNNLSEIFGRYIKKLIHRSKILQLEEPEQKLFIDSLQALASCAAKIIFKKSMFGFVRISTPEFSDGFKTNFQQLEKTVTQKMLSINSPNVQREADKAKSEIVNNIFVVLIDEIMELNRVDTFCDISAKGCLFLRLMYDVKTISKDLFPEDKLEIIKFFSKEDSNSDSRQKFDYLDYHNWDDSELKTATDFDYMFKLTIGKFDYSNLNPSANFGDELECVDSENGYYTKPINYYYHLMCYAREMASDPNCIKKELGKLATKLSLPDAINVIKNCHLNLLQLSLHHHYKEDLNKLLDDTKNVLIALLVHYKSKSKINSIIADIWEKNFQSQINQLSKMYDFDKMESGIPESLKKIAKDIGNLFAKVENVFSNEVQPKYVFDALKVFYEKQNDDKLKELIADDNIFNLFIKQVEQNVRELITEVNENMDFAQIKSLIDTMKDNSAKLSVDDKSKIVEFLLSEDFDYENNLLNATNKLENLVKAIVLNQNNSEEKINNGNNESQEKSNNGNEKVDKRENRGEINKNNGFSVNEINRNNNDNNKKNTASRENTDENNAQNNRDQNIETKIDLSDNHALEEGKKENKENEENDSDNTKNSLGIDDQKKTPVQGENFASDMQNRLSIGGPSHTEKEKEQVEIAQQNQEFKLELTLSDNKAIILSASSCETALTGLRKCSDFCYQICSIEEAIEQKKCSEASDCWSQLCKQFTWWESIKLTLYSLFFFRIAKWWRGNMNIEIKSSMPTRQNASFLKDNQDNKKVPDSKDKGKTFNNIDQTLNK